MKTRIISFHNGNLNPDLLKHQKMVFNEFGIPLEQIETKLSHPEAIDHFLNNEEWDIVVLFDADCIPLNNTIVDYAVKASLEGRVFGASQKASHIPNSQIYASPCFMAFSKETFELLGKPSFKATSRGDVAEEITYACRDKDVTFQLIYPSHVDKPMWELVNGVKFGYGTTYANVVYHAFESNANHGSTHRFIEKCKETLNC